jgi:hypothetical protein
VSQEPLSLLELSIACQLHEEENEEERLAFTRDEVEFCRLMVIIREDEVLLLHKSVKDFLISSNYEPIIHELKAHARFAYRCIDYLLEASNGEKESGSSLSDSFLWYCTQFWVDHAHLAGAEFSVRDTHAEFFDFNSRSREKWLQYYKEDVDLDQPVPEQFSILHIAARWGYFRW